MKKNELKQLIKEILKEETEQKWLVSFQTALGDDLGEEWVSVGKTEQEANQNLRNYFTKRNFPKNMFKWYGGDTKKYSGPEKPFTDLVYGWRRKTNAIGQI